MKIPLLTRHALPFLIAASISNAACADEGSDEAKAISIQRPNVILILADDMALGDLSCLNGGLSRTPHLDQLKRNSVWFNQAYSASPVCAPARAALLTGRYAHRTGAVTLNMEEYPKLCRIRRDEVTMADTFKANGYATGLIGKWHSGIGAAYHPLSRGFDEFEGFIGHLYVPSYFNFKLDIGRSTQSFPNRYLTTDLSARAVSFLKRHKDKPFFLHLAHYAPHRPIEAPAEKIQPYLDAGLNAEVATVYAMIEMMDDGIGDLLKTLDQLSLASRTIVIFASDNGPDPLVTKRFNRQLRGTKYMVHEGGIRVPFMVRWTNTLLPTKSDQPIHFTDVFPTLIEVCQLKRSASPKLDGRSVATALRGDAVLPERPLFWQWNRTTPDYSHNAAMRHEGWKLVRPFVTRGIPKKRSTRKPQLYDLVADPGETTDVADQHSETAASMDALLTEWASTVEADRTR